jgi:methionyl-tRNA formyltransferase
MDLTTYKHNIVICGIQEQTKEIVDYLADNDIYVKHIVTVTKDRAKKNKCEDTWVDYEDFAKERGIKIHYLETYCMAHHSDLEFFEENKFDIMLLGGWQRLIPDNLLETLIFGAIGQHGSPEPLPKGRGRSPINWALCKGDKRMIWNIFYLTPGVDDGDVIDSQIFEINEFDDCNTIYYKVTVAVKRMLVKSIPKILNRTISRHLKPQMGEASYYEKRTPDDGWVSFSNKDYNIHDVYNLIRAVTRPYPGAFAKFNGEKVMLWKSQIWDTIMVDYYANNKYGEIVEVFGNEFVVKCYGGLLLVTDHEDDNVYIGKVYD